MNTPTAPENNQPKRSKTFNFEKIGHKLALYACIAFILHLIIIGTYGIRYLYRIFPCYKEISNFNNPSILILWFSFEILIVLIAVSFLFSRNFFYEILYKGQKKLTLSPLCKIAVLIICYSFISPVYTLFFSIFFEEGYRIYIYNYDFVLNFLQLLFLLTLIPGFFLERYRKFLFLSRLDLFIFIVFWLSFFNATIKLLDFNFLSFLFYITEMIIVLAVLLPFLSISKYLQRTYKIKGKIKLKLIIFLYFFINGLVIIESGFQLKFGVFSLFLIPVIILFSLSRWIIDEFLQHNFSILKQIYSISLVITFLAVLTNIKSSFDKFSVDQSCSFLFRADFLTARVIDNEMILKLLAYEKNIYDKNGINIKLSQDDIKKNYDFFTEHLFSANLRPQTSMSIHEKQLFFHFNKDYKQAYMYLLDAFNCLQKYKQTEKTEYLTDFEINRYKYFLFYWEMFPEIDEINNLYKDTSPLKNITKEIINTR